VVGVIVAGVTRAENSCIVSRYPVQLDKTSRKLDLRKKLIQTICSEAFVGFEHLEELDFSANFFGTDLLKNLFKPLQNIIAIDLSFNILYTISFDEFADNKKLKHLNLIHNQISTIESITFEGKFSITTLLLDSNELVNVSELCRFKQLEILSLKANKNLDFSTFKPSCWSELQVLTLSDTGLNKMNNDYRLFTCLTKLEKLHIAKNNLKVFCAGNFPELPALEFLDIYENKLKSLDDVLVFNMKFSNLKVINMGNNPLACDYFNSLIRDFSKTGIEAYGDYCWNGNTTSKTIPDSDVCKLEDKLTTIELPCTTTTKSSDNQSYNSLKLQNALLELYWYFSYQIGITVVLFLIDIFLKIYFFRF
jgi:Leucine-rich repeat (LRR) protein